MTDRSTNSTLPKGIKILLGIIVTLAAGTALLMLTAMVMLQNATFG